MTATAHANKARETMLHMNEDWISQEGQTDAAMVTTAIFAQTEATLALAEQQRTANLIALLALSDQEATDLSAIAGITINTWDAIRRRVAEGLGI